MHKIQLKLLKVELKLYDHEKQLIGLLRVKQRLGKRVGLSMPSGWAWFIKQAIF